MTSNNKWAYFRDRFQHVMNTEKLSQARVARLLGINPSQVSRWLSKTNNQEAIQTDTAIKIDQKFSCGIEWIEKGVGAPYSTLEVKTLEEKPQFTARRELDENKKVLAELRRERFKINAPLYFNDLFDFIADQYGENEEGIREFLNEFVSQRGDYRNWLREKKEWTGYIDDIPRKVNNE